GGQVIYCIIPGELADRLLFVLRRHFATTPSVEVVMERRGGDRRGCSERRSKAVARAAEDRRHVLSGRGRRVADRRGITAPTCGPSLPAAVRRFADRIVFVESIRPTRIAQEDVEASRLIAAFQAGRVGAFEELYRRYFDR